MKRILIIIAVTLLNLSAKGQIKYPMYMDSLGYERVNAVPDGIGSSSPVNILSKSANYTIVSGDISPSKQPIIYLAVDCTSGSNTQTMPSATTYAGYTIKVTKTDATANTITISGVATDNIISVKGTVKEFISLSGNWVNN